MTTGPDNLYRLAETVLAAAQEILTDNGQTVPALSYVYAGIEPTAYCDSLVVTVPRIYHGRPAIPDQLRDVRGQFTPRSADLTLWVYRCLTAIPAGEGLEVQQPPPAAQFAYDAEQLLTDRYVLHRGFVAAWNSGAFPDQLTASETGSAPRALAVGDAVAIAEQGGVGGMTMLLQFEVA